MMVISSEYFQNHMEEILSESLETEEPIILKTGIGNFFVMPEREYRDMMGMINEGFQAEEEALLHIR